MRRKRLKITCPPTFTGWSTQRNAMFSGVFSCWRWENAFLSAIHRIQIFQCIFKLLPSDYHAENGIYSYIHRRFTPLTTWKSIDMFIIHTCFGKALFSLMKKKTKKKTTTTKKATSFHQSMPVWIKQIIACKPLSAAVCCFKESFTIKWKKSCQTNNQHLYSRIFVWKI